MEVEIKCNLNAEQHREKNEITDEQDRKTSKEIKNKSYPSEETKQLWKQKTMRLETKTEAALTQCKSSCLLFFFSLGLGAKKRRESNLSCAWFHSSICFLLVVLLAICFAESLLTFLSRAVFVFFFSVPLDFERISFIFLCCFVLFYFHVFRQFREIWFSWQ